ncbi:hypothetical protein C8Q74DRAFT_1218941 [Fomes fomentarius]|nr:hypothetical protein C8Q74DRAFT_1218941 [Fomes fomentarius]
MAVFALKRGAIQLRRLFSVVRLRICQRRVSMGGYTVKHIAQPCQVVLEHSLWQFAGKRLDHSRPSLEGDPQSGCRLPMSHVYRRKRNSECAGQCECDNSEMPPVGHSVAPSVSGAWVSAAWSSGNSNVSAPVDAGRRRSLSSSRPEVSRSAVKDKLRYGRSQSCPCNRGVRPGSMRWDGVVQNVPTLH